MLHWCGKLTLMACCMAAPLMASEQSQDLAIGWDTRVDRTVVSITGFAASPSGSFEPDDIKESLVVHVNDQSAAQPPAVLGKTIWDGNDRLLFVPRYKFVAGLSYRVSVRKPDGSLQQAVLARAARPADPPRLDRIFPSSGTLPENLLKIYLHFSSPMQQGDSYRHLKLIRDDGLQVDLPFLELEQELWDRSGKRLTVLFDPGRIKRGLKPRAEHGPILEEGRSFKLVIDDHWKDAHGSSLVKSYDKTIRVVAPDDTQPALDRWKIQQVAAGSRDPLVVIFAESLDHAMLQRVLRVTDTADQSIVGETQIADDETKWSFTPQQPWAKGDYRLRVDANLEDLAGNSIGRPFEVDVFRSIDSKIPEVILHREFRVD